MGLLVCPCVCLSSLSRVTLLVTIVLVFYDTTPAYLLSVGAHVLLGQRIVDLLPRVVHEQVPVEQLAADAVTLKELLKSYSLGNTVFGPSFGDVKASDAREYVPTAHSGAVNGFTVHNYPYARHCTVPKYGL